MQSLPQASPQSPYQPPSSLPTKYLGYECPLWCSNSVSIYGCDVYAATDLNLFYHARNMYVTTLKQLIHDTCLWLFSDIITSYLTLDEYDVGNLTHDKDIMRRIVYHEIIKRPDIVSVTTLHDIYLHKHIQYIPIRSVNNIEIFTALAKQTTPSLYMGGLFYIVSSIETELMSEFSLFMHDLDDSDDSDDPDDCLGPQSLSMTCNGTLIATLTLYESHKRYFTVTDHVSNIETVIDVKKIQVEEIKVKKTNSINSVKSIHFQVTQGNTITEFISVFKPRSVIPELEKLVGSEY